MGCCCSSQGQEDNVELISTTNDAVCCKGGQRGTNIVLTDLSPGCCYKVEGSGTVIGSCCLECDVAMWEVIVGKNPEGLAIGVKKVMKKTAVELDTTLDSEFDPNSPSWSLSDTPLQEGDVVGVYWDQTDLPMLSFSVNGKMVSRGSAPPTTSTQLSACVMEALVSSYLMAKSSNFHLNRVNFKQLFVQAV